MKPLVTTVIPTYNRAATLGRAIDSVLSQEEVFSEIVIVDDGSTDSTAEFLRSYGSRIRIICQDQSGAAAARNAGIAAADGKYIAFLDSDDEWYPEKLRNQIPVLEGRAERAIVGCGALFIRDGRVYDVTWQATATSLRNRLLKGPINTSGVMIRADSLRSLGVYFRTDLTVYEDSELWWRLVARHESLMLPQVLVRSHRAAFSVSDDTQLDEKLLSVDRFYRYLLQDEAVRQELGDDLRSYVAHRHYVASCSYYSKGKYHLAFRELMAGLKENTWDTQWMRLAASISMPPSLRPGLKRAIGWAVRHR